MWLHVNSNKRLYFVNVKCKHGGWQDIRGYLRRQSYLNDSVCSGLCRAPAALKLSCRQWNITLEQLAWQWMTLQWGWGFSVFESLFLLNVQARIYLKFIYNISTTLFFWTLITVRLFFGSSNSERMSHSRNLPSSISPNVANSILLYWGFAWKINSFSNSISDLKLKTRLAELQKVLSDALGHKLNDDNNFGSTKPNAQLRF